MQSVRQYRNLGARVQEQIERDRHKARILNRERKIGAQGISSVQDGGRIESPYDVDNKASPSGHDAYSRDPEKGEEPNADMTRVATHDRESNRESVESSIHDNDRQAHDTESYSTQDDGRVPLSRTASQVSTATQRSTGTGLGLALTGVDVRDRTSMEGGDRTRQVFVVTFEGEKDPMKPQNFPTPTRVLATVNIALIGAVVGVASSIDSSVLTKAAADFGVSKVVESMATGLYLCGFGCGSLFAGPISETFGRNPVYLATLMLYMIFIMASGLAPNIGAQLAFRFLAGFFGSTPLTCAGGSISDMWTPMERVTMFPIFAISAFLGPIFGPVMGGWISQSSQLSWKWTEWITLIISGLVLSIVVLFQPETYPPILLKWKASHLRRITGDDRYVSPLEIREDTIFVRLRLALYRPFVMTAQEPILILISLYLSVIYIILFTFFDGYDYIFGEIHGTSPGITGLTFLGIAVGLCSSTVLVPLISKWAKQDLIKIQERGGDKLPPEFRLWYCMLGGSVAIPVSLFWMGWTSYPSISIWSPLAASVLFGYGILCVFISSYQYIIDSYEVYAASALACVTFIRYVAAGAMVIVGIPFYENVGVHWTCSILAILGAVLVPVPYVFFKYGHVLRSKSKYAVTSSFKGGR